MRSTTLMASATGLASLVLAVSSYDHFAAAEEQVLNFRLVTRAIDAKTFELPGVEGQVAGMGRYHGVATFDDGRIASKDFIFSFDFNKGAGPFYGYSTYTFDDGSSVTARFAGEQKAGQPMHGEYTVLSGTGAFAGVKGHGHFDGVPVPWEDAGLYTGQLMLTVPGD